MVSHFPFPSLPWPCRQDASARIFRLRLHRQHQGPQPGSKAQEASCGPPGYAGKEVEQLAVRGHKMDGRAAKAQGVMGAKARFDRKMFSGVSVSHSKSPLEI